MSILHDYWQRSQLSHANIILTDKTTAMQLAQEFIEAADLNAADFLLFDGETALKVGDARTIRRFVDMSRFTSPIKLIVVADANQLTPEAANALLKTLEEPPPATHFILATTRIDNLLPTVRSRCQVLSLPTEFQAQAETASYTLPTNLLDGLIANKELAASDLPLPNLLSQWLTDIQNSSRTTRQENQHRQNILLHYLGLAQTSVNRRLLLDNLLLEIYNTD